MRGVSSVVRRKNVVTALAVGALLTIAVTAAPGHAENVGKVANAGSADAVDGSYLVVFEKGERADVAGEYGVRVLERYDSALNGVLIRAEKEQAQRIAADPSVRRVEQNTRVERVTSHNEASHEKAAHDKTSHRTTQPDPPSCGLDRIDQPALPLDGSYSYPARAGAGVDVYMLDTGIDYDHPDLKPRAKPGFDAFGGKGEDENGNGTAMAGIVGGTDYGVAKKATLISVKVLDAEAGGTIAGVVKGIDWITEHASGPSVANVVIGVPASDVLDDAVRKSIASGVTYSMEGGADSDDVANSSPARVAEGITVGSSDCADKVAPFSNHGKGMDIYAPGVDITSDAPGGGTQTMSGTTVSGAHVSGAAALLLGRHPKATPREVGKALDRAAVDGALKGVPSDGTPDKLLQVKR